MKIRPLGAESFHKDRRTDEKRDLTKLIVAFRNFTDYPKDSLKCCASRFYLQ